jgi:hypothetical protein
MQTEAITIPRADARHLYREYKKHKHYSEPMDDEIRRAYQLLAQGRLIIKAIESVIKAGLNGEGWPKLALCRADSSACTVGLNHEGGAIMQDDFSRRGFRSNSAYHASRVITIPHGSFPRPLRGNWRAEALLPPIPLHLRPKRGLANYHILWEAEWQRAPPRDPYLLRRIGSADMWLVVAMWNLTEVERAALAARIPNA